MELPDPTSSIIIFVFTFCVGYITILLAFYRARRLSEWITLDGFDKTIITFIVGGIITFSSFIALNAPVYSLLYAVDVTATSLALTQLSSWLSKNFGVTVVFELILILLISLVIQLFLERHDEDYFKYAV